MKRRFPAAALLAFTVACGDEVVDPCTSPKPILQISAAQGTPTGTRIPILMISNVRLDGQPIDTADLRLRSFNVQRLSGIWFDCTVPCSLGYQPGTYTFDAYARGYYPATVQAVADYSNTPTGCPASHGTPTNMAVALAEADSARVSFHFSAVAGVTLRSADITFDDGSGFRSLNVGFNRQTFEIRNSGNLSVRFVVGHPDTVGVAELNVPLRKDRHWFIGAYLANQNPLMGNTCASVRSYPMRRAVQGADSLYVGWVATPISWSLVC